MTVRTRFAPSPTGFLHVGSARTALFCWLYTRHTQGKFILRIEDTDLERSTPEHVQAILEGMHWLDLDYDEGPYYQTKRFDRYKAVIEQMLAEGSAYRCYCTKERLDELREGQMARKEKPQYDGRCRELKTLQAGPYVVRFRNPQEGAVSFDDAVNGKIEFKNSELDDLILARSDGSPTYNFTVVVDDLDMNISHVIRGADHINNTPRQINILKALGGTPPTYAHVPMILGSDGKKLSKRHGAVGVMQYREDGFLPHALLNYLVRLGWSHGDQEIFSREEMIRYFDIQQINNSAAIFNTEKLIWLNQHYLKTLDPHEVSKELAWHMERQGIDLSTGPALFEIVKVQAERCKTLKEMAEKSRYFYEEPASYEVEAVKKNLSRASADLLNELMNQFQALPAWNPESIHAVILQTAATRDLKLGKIAQPLRIALTGGTISPPIDATLFLLGKDRSLKRLQKASTFCEALP